MIGQVLIICLSVASADATKRTDYVYFVIVIDKH